MNLFDVKLLDCSLRDGGYVNDWKWGYFAAKDIINSLIKSNVDIIEVGFLRNINTYNPDVTVSNRIEELNGLIPKIKTTSMFSAMAMRSNYDITKLSDYNGSGIEMIRVTAHDFDIKEGLEFSKAVKDKGYKVSFNPINIMGYSDKEILWIVNEVNKISPYQFAIVDTFGSMKSRDLDRIASLVNHNLNKDIRLALHLHENMSLSCLLAQKFFDYHLDRPISIDASLMGIGRIPGNLPIELIADYLNEYASKNYDIDYMMDSIQDYILPLKGNSPWGYTPAYFLSAKYNLHRNYAEHYLNKGNLTHRDINMILSLFDKKKASVFDRNYADKMYNKYICKSIDDAKSIANLKTMLNNRNILIIAPGITIKTHKDIIDEFIKEKDPLVIALNFEPAEYKFDLAFFSNNKRYSKITKKSSKIIATSNLSIEFAKYYINYNTLLKQSGNINNSYLLLLNLLSKLGCKRVYVCGADGYKENTNNYYQSDFVNLSNPDNELLSKQISKTNIAIDYITPSCYSTSALHKVRN